MLLFVNGEGATFTRWIGGEFSPDFAHHDVEAALSATDLTLVLSWADIGRRSFNFSVATLREHADLAPGVGIATYPRTRTRVHAHRVPAGPAPSLTPRSALTQTPARSEAHAGLESSARRLTRASSQQHAG